MPQSAGDGGENAQGGEQHRRQIYHRGALFHLRPAGLDAGGEIFMAYFKEHLERLFAGALDKGSAPAPRDYMLNHMVCDFAETVRWWMKHDSYSAEEISRFFFATTPWSSAAGRR